MSSDINKIKEELKKEPIVKRMFKQYGRDLNEIDKVSIKFAPLDVSAKTVNGHIYLNEKMKDDDYKSYRHYIVHELTHYLQHTSDKCLDEEPITDDNYLDNPSEQEAFQNQLEYKEKTEPKQEVEDYLKQLFDRYDLDRDERKEKLKELLPNKD